MKDENNDYEKELLKSMDRMNDELGSLKKKVDSLEKSVNLNFGFLSMQAIEKGKWCARIGVTHDGQRYCTARPYKSINEAFKKNYMLLGARYYPKPGGYECFVCWEFERIE